jgi:DnaA family protein
MAIEQLTLNLQPNELASFSTFFVTDENQMLVSHVQKFLKTNSNNYIYLWGKSGAGKSHVLQASYMHAQRINLSAVYLQLQQALSPEILENLEYNELICLDDINVVAGNKAWEQGLFHLFNRIKDAGKYLLISANTNPKELTINLADLQSRLTSGLIFEIHPLSDKQKRQALQLHAEYRSMQLSDDVGDFLLARWPRDMQQLFHALNMLDRASLSEQRKLTIPFVKQTLNL